MGKLTEEELRTLKIHAEALRDMVVNAGLVGQTNTVEDVIAIIDRLTAAEPPAVAQGDDEVQVYIVGCRAEHGNGAHHLWQWFDWTEEEARKRISASNPDGTVDWEVLSFWTKKSRPVPALVDEEALAKCIAKVDGCDIGLSQEYVRCIREIPSCGCRARAHAIIASGILRPMPTREALENAIVGIVLRAGEDDTWMAIGDDDAEIIVDRQFFALIGGRG